MSCLVPLILTLTYKLFLLPLSLWSWKRPFSPNYCLLGFARVLASQADIQATSRKLGPKGELHFNSERNTGYVTAGRTLFRFLFTCSFLLKSKKGKKEGKYTGCFFCRGTALLQRVKTRNIKACFGLDIGGERKGELRGSWSLQPMSLPRISAKEKKDRALVKEKR